MSNAERNLQWAAALVSELVRRGVGYFALAPGSRSSPLAVAVAQASRLGREAPCCTVHYDERAVAFQALGYARGTGRPAAVVTTSGSAVANLLPGVVEASQTNTPMLVLTADRPAELRGTGANQTIDQVEVFGTYCRWFADLAPGDPSGAARVVDEAMARAMGHPGGPVHLNLMFPEPLVPEPDDGRRGEKVARDRSAADADVRPPAGGATVNACRADVPSADHMDGALETLCEAKKGLLVVGSLPSPAAAAAVQELSDHLGWPMLPDITSGLRTGPGSAHRIANFDALLQEGICPGPPDTVLHVGGPCVSKRLARYLASSRPDVLVQASGPYGRVDPDGIVTHRLGGTIEAFCVRATEGRVGHGSGGWLEAWKARDALAGRALAEALDGGEGLREPWLARRVSELLPSDHALVLGNSMPVRDMNTFAATCGHRARVLANRGASGIDGTLATGAGFARGTGAPATVLLGDLALLHDLTSLHLVARSEQPMAVVVVNNDGGGIFHFLPIARHQDVFEPFFGTPHGRDFEAAARQFSLAYARPGSRGEFDAAYRRAADGGTAMLIEVATEREENVRVHEELLREVREIVRSPGAKGTADGTS